MVGNFQKLLGSFRCAWRGLKYALKNEQNFQLEILAAVFVISLMFILDVLDWQKVALFLVISMVLVIELINTMLERVVDILKPRVHPYAQFIKDVMAAAVLMASIGAVVIGAIIFYPYIREIFLQRF